MDAKQSLGEPRLLISRDALLHNAALVRKAIAPGTRICAVVKADAYGHGADIVIDALYNFSTDNLEGPAVDALAVATVDEAEALPGNALPTFILRPVENGFIASQRIRIECAIRNGWTLTLCSPSAADDVARIALALNKRASVQVMLDTGMSRTGAAPEHLGELLRTIAGHASLRLAALGTHFSEAEKPDSRFTLSQIERFRSAAEALPPFPGKVLVHAANSAGLFFYPESHFDMVRPGLSLYGLDPTFHPSIDRPLRPALKWIAPLIGIRAVRQGTPVGYGQSWLAPRDTKIGLIPIGYADGYLRAFSNRARVLLDHKPLPVIGTVSMDSITIDLGPDSQAIIGDEVTLLDDNPLSPVSAYALARWADTIPYEIFCRIGPRVCRVVREVEPAADDKVTR